MGILERLGLVEKAAPPPPLYETGYNVPSSRYRDFESFLRAYAEVAWVYNAVAVKARAMGSVKYRVLDAAGNEIERNDFTALLERPNEYQTYPEWIETVVMHLELTGNAVSYMAEIDAGGRPVALLPLRPSRVKIVRGATGPVGYLYHVNNRDIPYEPREILHVKYPNPVDEFWGLGPIEAGARQLDVEIFLRDYLKYYFGNNARPGGVLKFAWKPSGAEAQQYADLFRVSHRGPENTNRVAILPDGVTFEPIGSDPGQAAIVDLISNSRDTILPLFGVPKQKVGIFEDANYRSTDADNFFWAETMTPLIMRVERALNRLAALYGCRLEFERVDVQDRDTDSNIIGRLVATGSFTRNEVREAYGAEPLPDALGNVLIGPLSVVDLAPVALSLAPVTKAGRKRSPAGPRLLDAHKRFVAEAERAWLPRIRALFEQELRAVVERIPVGKSAKAAGKYTFGADDLYDAEQARALWIRLLMPLYQQSGQAATDALMSVQGLQVAWDVMNPEVQRFVEGIARRPTGAVTSVPESTRDAIRDVIAEGQRRGYSVYQLTEGVPDESYKGIRGVFQEASEYRAQMIARTEAATSHNLASAYQYRQAGVQQVEVFDGDGDEECASVDGTIQTLDWADANPIAHPHCVRAFAAIVD